MESLFLPWHAQFCVAKKLKALKEDIHLWNLKDFENVEVKKKRLLEKLVKLDRKEGVIRITLEEKRERDRVISEVKRLALFEEISLKQKSRILWLKVEDNNSRFFIGWLIIIEEIIIWVI